MKKAKVRDEDYPRRAEVLDLDRSTTTGPYLADLLATAASLFDSPVVYAGKD
jgi:hypothetical protein